MTISIFAGSMRTPKNRMRVKMIWWLLGYAVTIIWGQGQWKHPTIDSPLMFQRSLSFCLNVLNHIVSAKPCCVISVVWHSLWKRWGNDTDDTDKRTYRTNFITLTAVVGGFERCPFDWHYSLANITKSHHLKIPRRVRRRMANHEGIIIKLWISYYFVGFSRNIKGDQASTSWIHQKATGCGKTFGLPM